MNRFVYLDNNATTKITDIVKQKIEPFLESQYGNPSSIYGFGVKAKRAITESRLNCATLIGAKPENIVFTSGGSEGNCSAINSAINKYPNKKKIITTSVEHSSILEYCKLLERKGYEIAYLKVNKNCQIDIRELESKIDDNTCLVSVQLANNEVGAIVVNDKVLKCIKKLKEYHDFDFHIDCVQGLGKYDISVKRYGADYMSFSGHKIHCPKGIGMLYINDTTSYTPLIAGHQERGLRGGTENIMGIVAMGESCKYIKENFNDIANKMQLVNAYLESQLLKIKGITINCKNVMRIPNTTSITFGRFNGNQIMFKLETQGILVSTGSACNSESSDPSYVLTSMCINNPQNTIRISIDENTTESQIDYFVDRLRSVLKEN